MTTELLQKYAHLADLVRQDVEQEINDALLQRVVIELTFDNIQYLIHKSVIQAFTHMHDNGLEYKGLYETELDMRSAEKLASTIAERASKPDFIDRTLALA